MVGLAGEVGGDVIVLFLLESGVAEVAPENCGHAKFVSVGESLTDFDDLAIALVGAEINGGAYGDRTHVISLLDVGEENLVGLVGESQKLVVIELHQERNFVGVLASDGAKNSESGRNGVTLALDGQLDDV